MPVDGGGGGGELRAASAPSNRQLHVPPCDNAQQHVQLVELGSAITAALAVDEDVALLHRAVRHHGITGTSPGCSPAEWIAPNASTTRFSLSAHERVSASAVRRESDDQALALESGPQLTPPSLPRPNRTRRC